MVQLFAQSLTNYLFLYHTTSFMKVGSNMMSTSVSKVLKMMLKSKSMDTDGSSQ